MKDRKTTRAKKKLYFLAVLPNEGIREEVTSIKKDFAEKFSSKAALKSPPHITLFPPFYFELQNERQLVSETSRFSSFKNSFEISLHNFKAFSPRVIYIDVIENEELISLQESVENHFKERLNLESKRRKERKFSPHMTVAFSDLTKENFHRAWIEYKEKTFSRNFTANGLTLLRHNGKTWEELFTSEFNNK